MISRALVAEKSVESAGSAQEGYFCGRSGAYGEAAVATRSHLQLSQQRIGRLNVSCVDSCLYSQSRCQGRGLMAVVKRYYRGKLTLN